MSAIQAPSRETPPTVSPLLGSVPGHELEATRSVDPFSSRRDRSRYPDEEIAERLFPGPDCLGLMGSPEPLEPGPLADRRLRWLGLVVTLSLAVAAGILLLL